MVTKKNNDFFFKDLRKNGFNTNNRFFTIAEIGINHNGEIDQALRLIDAAHRSGADSVKFQTYVTEKRVKKDSEIFQILKNCELSYYDFEKLKKHADDLGIAFFSTPFDEESVDFLESLDVPFYKIASFDIVNRRLLRKVKEQNKPVIISTGMSNLKEVSSALKIFDNKSPVTLLHCVSAYPTLEKDSNIASIDILRNRFENVVGQSDHTPGIKTSLYSFLRGAQVLEKHFKLDENFKCVDFPVSITESQMSSLVEKLREADLILGEGEFKASEAEDDTLKYRRFS